jgi:hypothetical protein
VTPTLSVAVKVVIGTTRELDVAGIAKAETTGGIVSKAPGINPIAKPLVSNGVL